MSFEGRIKRTIIGISGKIGSGKTTTAIKLGKLFEGQGGKRFHVEQMAFADPLKRATAKLYGFPLEWCYSRTGKARTIESENMTVGQLLQCFATMMRKAFGEDFWARRLAEFVEECTEAYRAEASAEHLVVIISDVRYYNEAEMLRAMNGVIVRLNGDPAGERKICSRDLMHVSEVDLDDYAHFLAVVDTDKNDAKTTAELLFNGQTLDDKGGV